MWVLVAAWTGCAPAAPVEAEPVLGPVAAEPAESAAATVAPIPEAGPFVRELAPGLRFAGYEPPEIAEEGFSEPDPAAVAGCDPRLFVVTIDPAAYRLEFVSGLDPSRGEVARTGPDWAEHLDAHVVFNPGMFEPGGRGTGYTRGGRFVSQPALRRNAMYRGWFAAEPAGDAGPARVIDLVPPKGAGTYGAFAELPAAARADLDGYEVVAQSLAILRDGAAVYPTRTRQWSELAFGADDQGRIVVVWSRYPYEMRELGALVAGLGVGIRDLVHGEGGPEATLVVRAGGIEWVGLGSYETGFYDDSNDRAWALPNVMAARPR